MSRRIVCAAIKAKNGPEVALGPRHFSPTMHDHITLYDYHGIDSDKFKFGEQGFIDQFGEFMCRREAFEVAEEAGQIINTIGTEHTKELYSENLY